MTSTRSFSRKALFAAPVFRGGGRSAAVRRTMRVSGMLCLAGALGPASGDLRLQYLGIAGYAAVFPVVCVLLARWFASRAPAAPATR